MAEVEGLYDVFHVGRYVLRSLMPTIYWFGRPAAAAAETEETYCSERGRELGRG